MSIPALSAGQKSDMNSSFKSYLTGFIFSVALTLVAYFSVAGHWFKDSVLIALIMFCGVLQFIIQLIYFLHMGREEKPRWNFTVFLSTMGVVFILVAGSLWIMYHLNYNMMPAQVSDFIMHDEGVHKERP